MAVYYGKIRLLVPSVADGKNATITSERGTSRTVEMSAPITDVMLAGMEKYNVQAGTGQSSASIGFGEMKKIITEDASAITVASMPTKTSYLVGENLDLTGTVINATIQKGDGTSETRDVTAQCDFDPANGTQLNTEGTQRVDVEFLNLASFFNVDVTTRILITSALPSNFNNQYDKLTALVLNKEIHIVGSTSGDNSANVHYKWNGTAWESVSTPPSNFESAVVYDGKIYGFPNQSSYVYVLDNGTWTRVASTPNRHDSSVFVVAQDGIHMLGGTFNDDMKGHYIFNGGSSWSQSVALPNKFSYAAAVVFNNEVHVLGCVNSSDSRVLHFKFDGTSWTQVSTLPTAVVTGWTSSAFAFVFNDEIYLYISPTLRKWNGSSWVTIGNSSFSVPKSAVATNKDIYFIGFRQNTHYRDIAYWDGTSWTTVTA